MPAPPYSVGKMIPSSPSLPSSLIVANGNSPASSHFITLGRISRSANSRTLFCRCSCSSFSWKSKIPPPGVILLRRLQHRGKKATDRPVGHSESLAQEAAQAPACGPVEKRQDEQERNQYADHAQQRTGPLHCRLLRIDGLLLLGHGDLEVLGR